MWTRVMRGLSGWCQVRSNGWSVLKVSNGCICILERGVAGFGRHHGTGVVGVLVGCFRVRGVCESACSATASTQPVGCVE